jgi:uncharacterized protein YkwD
MIPSVRYLNWSIGVALTLALILFLATATAAPLNSDHNPAAEPTVANFLPLITRAEATPEPPPVGDALAYVNWYRQQAGVPPVAFSAGLNDNCWQHARYMAENNVLTHNQDPGLPYASLAGQICAESGNAWLGGAATPGYWQPYHSIDGWMSSVGHRLWLLYPTTPTFGYGFYTAAGSNRAGAALDILSTADFAADSAYSNWPVRYPASGQTGIPVAPYAISLLWPYFGSAPLVTTTSLVTEEDAPVAHTVTTNLPAGHRGIQIVPVAALPASTTLTVSASGTYDGVPFSYSWSFTTSGSPANPINP